MILKKIFTTIVTTSLLFTVSVSIINAQVVTNTCAQVTKNISFGSKGADVTTLQNFFISVGYLGAGNNSSFYGKLTQQAVQSYQAKNNIVTSGTPSSTGFGNVGRLTRASINAQLCLNKTPASTAPSATTTQNTTTTKVATTVSTSTAVKPNTETVVRQKICSAQNLSSENRNIGCGTNQTGTLIQVRNSYCLSEYEQPVWTEWRNETNTCKVVENFSTVSGAYEAGGTDYVTYDLGSYGTNMSPITFNLSAENGGIRFVINHYHLNPTKVKSQLQSMCTAGQKKIGLQFWHTDSNTGQTDPAKWAGGAIDSTGGQLVPQLKSNINSVLSDIKATKSQNGNNCFNEVQIRLLPIQGTLNDPETWTTWNQTMYNSNKKFLLAVRTETESNLVGSGIRRFYDLAGEMAGVDKGQASQYMERLWREYTTEFGKSDTYGFTIVPLPGRITKLIEVYDKVGVRPDQYAIDVYDFPDLYYSERKSMLGQLYPVIDELRAKNELWKPILIQETYYSDTLGHNELSFAKTLGLQIRSIMQWQASRETEYMPNCPTPDQKWLCVSHFSIAEPITYLYTSMKNIFPALRITSAGYGCDDRNCGLVFGEGFTEQCRVDMYDFADSSKKIGSLDKKDNPGINTLLCADDRVSFKIPSTVTSKTNKMYITITNKYNTTSEKVRLDFGIAN
jgi:hypothetical protein